MWLNRFTRAELMLHRTLPIWRAYMGAALRTALIAGLVVIGFGLLFFDPGPEHRMMVFYSALGGVLAGLAECLFGMVRASGRVNAFFALRDLIMPLGILALIALVRPHVSDHAMLIHIGVWAVGLATAAWLLQRGTGLFTTRAQGNGLLRRRIAGHHLALALSNLSSRLAAYCDILALAWYAPIVFVGEYRVAAQFAIGFWIVQHFMFLGLPWQVRRLTRDDGKAGSAVVLGRQRLLLVLALGGLVALGLLAAPILSLFGERFVDSMHLFQLLLLLRFTDLLWGPQHELMVSNRLAREDAWANGLALVAWPTIFVACVATGNPIGAALSAGVASAIVSRLYRHSVIRRAGLDPHFGHPGGLYLPLGLGAATVALAWLV
jgi:hypothetical protein